MLHLTSLPVLCYSKAQATTISIIASLLPGVSWRSLTKAPQLAAAHTPASRTNPNEARQFRVEFNKSRARATLRNCLRRTTFGTVSNAILYLRQRSMLYGEKTGALAPYTLDMGHTGTGDLDLAL